MFPLLIPLIIIGGTLLIGGTIALLCKKAQKIAIFGTTESGKTTLWRALQGLPVGNSYHATVDRAGVRSFKFQKSNGETVTVAKGIDIPGKDEIFVACLDILNSDKTVVLFLVSAMDVMRGKTHESGSRLRKIKMSVDKHEDCAIILVLTHKRDFVCNYGDDRISEVVGKAHNLFNRYTKEGYKLLELTDSSDVNKIKDLF